MNARRIEPMEDAFYRTAESELGGHYACVWQRDGEPRCMRAPAFLIDEMFFTCAECATSFGIKGGST